MKLRNKILSLVLAVVLVLGLSGCGASKEGVVSYANYEKIVKLADATSTNPVTKYNEVIVLLGAASDYSHYNSDSGNGYVTWTNADGATVKVTFSAHNTVNKISTGLFQSTYTTPIGVRSGFWEWIIIQLGYFTFYASSLFGLLTTHYYWLGLLIMTLVVRTLGWPIYAKSNDMTIKMQEAQPEIAKVQEKYRGRKDQASQQRMQMETMEIYKKYKINFFGCLMPLLQMPIFIAMYQVVQRFPRTEASFFNGGTSVFMNTNFLWTNLGNTAWLPNLPLAILVGILMFLSQWFMQHKTKKMQEKQHYYQDPKSQQSQKTMKYFMYFMVIMMVYIAIGNAGIAFYWIIGTAYQLFQSYMAHRNMGKRKEQLRRKV